MVESEDCSGPLLVGQAIEKQFASSRDREIVQVPHETEKMAPVPT
ncbi:hypothetical protein V1278_000180 [Bradyrhizobium sp. AZCC 1577]